MSSHRLVEVAEGLWQCPECGAGPGLYWALSDVEEGGGSFDARCVTFKPEMSCYVITYLFWEVDEFGARLADSLTSDLLGYLSTAVELATAPLPHTCEPPRKLVLKPGMFPSPLGEKAYGQKAVQRGRSSAGPSPEGSGGRSQRRRRKAGQ